MQDGLHRIGDDEVQLVVDGVIERRVKLDAGENSTVTVTRVFRLDPADGDPRVFFDEEVRALEDADQHISRCGFCQKTSAEVLQLIAGPTTHICNECVTLCGTILAEET